MRVIFSNSSLAVFFFLSPPLPSLGLFSNCRFSLHAYKFTPRSSLPPPPLYETISPLEFMVEKASILQPLLLTKCKGWAAVPLLCECFPHTLAKVVLPLLHLVGSFKEDGYFQPLLNVGPSMKCGSPSPHNRFFSYTLPPLLAKEPPLEAQLQGPPPSQVSCSTPPLALTFPVLSICLSLSFFADDSGCPTARSLHFNPCL